MRKHITQHTCPMPFPAPYKIFNINTERWSTNFLALPVLLAAVFFLLLASGCSKSSDSAPIDAATLATVVTDEVGAISQTTGSSGGHILDDGGASVSARGICWSTSHDPTISNSKTILSSDGRIFTSYATGLLPATTYYIRAYATNSVGTAYGNEVLFTTSAVSTTTVTDIDGNIYPVKTIGNQTWMLENLKTTHYQNGDEIPSLNDAAWGSTTSGAVSVYNNEAANNSLYGKLYNWHAGVDSRKIAPPGWHVPSREEWETLINFLGGSSTAGGELKEAGLAHWTTPNTGATNSSGFNGLPNGSRLNTGAFSFIGNSCYWWTITEDFAEANAVLLKNDGTDALIITGSRQNGAAIRCIKD
ncbi:fibrobacter succinogenes major paralogous domain-containing protein [Solitalea sp. MAHUQ-68]|uniref:Fibrobacter succinogenes major paralogous domain-containing protein n=1 Tax=Solitalea agri TaxID=2953739 RepID=A0A9X2JCW6_9SPHI|nr:fibrobacter succinogenes major paralogous domain-containing protein [Solitalea agri]MCO4292974.1 fibrobacter succinogenes major paralogous domain-containing protein [Solitalea agri]